MPYIIALLGLIGAAYLFVMRARMAADAARELTGVAQDVLSAARRFGFRRKLNSHPVESLEEPDVAIAAAGIAFLELGGLPTAEQQDALVRSLQSHLGQSYDRAEESVVLGRWLVTESGGASPGLTRLTRRLHKMKGTASFEPLMAVLRDVAAAGRGGMSVKQKEAIDEIGRLYRIT
ncbi:MAG: hypothetical protein HC844_10255 [Tabrizicola sp.]|nr:hypothetical protein [Tabrizicola sp.]